MGAMIRRHYSKKRNNVTRKRKPLVFIMAEGKNKTETSYFKEVSKEKNRIIKFSTGNNTDPVNMISNLKKYVENNDFNPKCGDKAFCLIDMDLLKNKNNQVLQADYLAKRNDIQIIVSSPCFEFWYLCHFEFCGKKYNSNKELLKHLQKYIPNYSKASEDIYDLIKNNTEIAIENAKRIEDNNLKNKLKLHTDEFTPSTEVYHIIEELDKKQS